MAKTVITTAGYDRKMMWQEELFRDTALEGYFTSRLGGDAVTKLMKGQPFDSSPNDVMQIKTDLQRVGKTKSRNGDKMRFMLLPRIDPVTNPGVISGQTLKGKEVNVSTYYMDIELERYRQAVSAASPMDWNRAAWDIPVETRTLLQNWGTEKLDLLCFDALNDTPTKTFYKTSAGVLANATYETAKSAITVAADSKLTPAMISFIKAWASTGGARSQIPLRPIQTDGGKYYVMLVHPDVMYDWKQDPTVQQYLREAMERGSSNPLFKNATAIYDNVVIHENEHVEIGTDAGGGAIPYAKCHFLGAQALVAAWGERPDIVEDDEDYEEDLYYAWRMTFKVAKAKFNSVDYGTVCVVTSRTNVSGA